MGIRGPSTFARPSLKVYTFISFDNSFSCYFSRGRIIRRSGKGFRYGTCGNDDVEMSEALKAIADQLGYVIIEL